MEVAHEALIRNWPLLRKWIDADRVGFRTRTRLTEAARDWENAGRDAAFFYTGARLAVALEWARSHSAELSTGESEFLRCSLEAEKQREAGKLEAAQRLARAEAERAEEAERRAQEQKQSASKVHVVQWAAGAAIAALILLALSVFEMYREESAATATKLAAESARIAAVSANNARAQADQLINSMHE